MASELLKIVQAGVRVFFYATGQELKLVYPQPGVDPARFEGLDFERFALQPMDGPARAENTAAAIAYCLAHPRWRLSVQTHKYLGIP